MGVIEDSRVKKPGSECIAVADSINETKMMIFPRVFFSYYPIKHLFRTLFCCSCCFRYRDYTHLLGITHSTFIYF